MTPNSIFCLSVSAERKNTACYNYTGWQFIQQYSTPHLTYTTTHTYTHTHTRLILSLGKTLCSMVAIAILKPITALNLSSLKSKEPGMKIAPIKFALLSKAFHCGHHVTSRNLRSFPDTRPTVHCVFPHPPSNSRKRQHYKSIYKLWQASGRGWKWTMADEGYWKTFSFAGVGSEIILLFSWHRKPNSFSACACACGWWIRDSRGEERGRESVACVGRWIWSSGNVQQVRSFEVTQRLNGLNVEGTVRCLHSL